MLIPRIDEVLRHYARCHLKARHIAVELTPHLRTGEAARCSQVPINDTVLFTERLVNDTFYTAILRHGIEAATPVAEMRPPRAADETRLAVEELAIDTIALVDDDTFPFPQRPIPAAVRENDVTTFLIRHLLR